MAVAASGAAARPGRRGRRERCLCTRPLGQARVPPTAAAVAAFGVGHWQRRRAPAPSVVSATAPAAVPVIGAARVAGAARGPRHSRHGWPLVGRGEEEWCRCRRRHCPPQPLRAVPASPPRRKCPQVPLGAVQRSARGVTCAAAGRDGGCGGSGGHGGRSVGGGGGGHPLPRWSARAVGATLASRWWGLFPSAGRRGAAPGLVCQSRHHFEAWRGGRPLTGAAAFPALLADPSRGGGAPVQAGRHGGAGGGGLPFRRAASASSKRAVVGAGGVWQRQRVESSRTAVAAARRQRGHFSGAGSGRSAVGATTPVRWRGLACRLSGLCPLMGGDHHPPRQQRGCASWTR